MSRKNTEFEQGNSKYFIWRTSLNWVNSFSVIKYGKRAFGKSRYYT